MTAIKQPLKTLPGVIAHSRWLPPRMCLYGAAGIGKSTFGASAPDVIFIPTESGVENLDVARFPVADTLDRFLNNLDLVAREAHDHKAVVIDTLNGLMGLYHDHYKGKPGFDFANYGGTSAWKSVAMLARKDIMAPLDACQKRGMYVIVLAHTGTINQKNPLGEDYMKFIPSINKYAWEEFCGWFDVIGRADYKFTVGNVTVNLNKGQVVKRVGKANTDAENKVKVRRLIFEGGLEQDTKSRIGYELPAEIELSWDVFSSHLGNLKALAGEIRALWHFLDDERAGTTLQWLGIDGLDRLAEANRSKLSQLRNRLLEVKAESEGDRALETDDSDRAVETAPETDPGAAV